MEPIKDILEDIMEGATEYWIDYNYKPNTEEWFGQYEDGKWLNRVWNDENDNPHTDFTN